jgi:sterol desaturase/sphingolipid hydroxylase (fatty acid hydroxylase superfamily)
MGGMLWLFIVVLFCLSCIICMLALLLMPLASLHFCVGLDFMTSSLESFLSKHHHYYHHHQLIQKKLADMCTEIALGYQAVLRVGRLMDEGM